MVVRRGEVCVSVWWCAVFSATPPPHHHHWPSQPHAGCQIAEIVTIKLKNKFFVVKIFAITPLIFARSNKYQEKLILDKFLDSYKDGCFYWSGNSLFQTIILSNILPLFEVSLKSEIVSNNPSNVWRMFEVCQVAKWQTSYILQTFGVGHVSNNFLRYGLCFTSENRGRNDSQTKPAASLLAPGKCPVSIFTHR